MAETNGKSVIDLSLIELNDISDSETNIDDEIEDPFCNENNPLKITFQDVTSAAFMIRNGVELTPCPVIFFFFKFNFIYFIKFFFKIEIEYFKTCRNGYLFKKGVSSVYRQVSSK